MFEPFEHVLAIVHYLGPRDGRETDPLNLALFALTIQRGKLQPVVRLRQPTGICEEPETVPKRGG